MDDNAIFPLFDNWRFEPKPAHRGECSIQSFADILIRRVGKLVNDPDDRSITRKLFPKNICCSDVAGQLSRTFDLDSIVKDADVNIYGNAVIPMQQCIGKNLVESFGWVLDCFEAASP